MCTDAALPEQSEDHLGPSSVRQDSDRVVNGRAGFEDNVVVYDAELVSSHEPYFCPVALSATHSPSTFRKFFPSPVAHFGRFSIFEANS